MKTITIKDYYGNYQYVPVSDELYEEWRQLHNESQRVYRNEMRHRSPYTLDEVDDILYQDSASQVEDSLLQREAEANLRHAIATLTPLQRKRIQLLLEDLSLRDLSDQEHRHYNTVKESVLSALRKIQQELAKE